MSPKNGQISASLYTNCQAFVQISNPKSSIQRFGQKADTIISDHPPTAQNFSKQIKGKFQAQIKSCKQRTEILHSFIKL